MCNRQNTFEFCKLNLKTSQKAVYECLLFKFRNRSVHITNKFYERYIFLSILNTLYNDVSNLLLS